MEELAVDVLTTLLLGRMATSSRLWKQMLRAIVPSLPFLQAYIGKDPTFDQCVLELMEAGGPAENPVTADADVVALSSLERFRVALRMMFAKDPKLRTRGITTVMWFLTNEQGDGGPYRLFPSELPSDLHDLFIVSQVTRSTHTHVTVPHSHFQKSEVSFSHCTDVCEVYKVKEKS